MGMMGTFNSSFLRVGKYIITLVLILSSVESNTVCSAVPSDSMVANMIADIYHHHHTDCATLIMDSCHPENDFQERSNNIKTQKSLSRLFIPTTMVGSNKLDYSRVYMSSRRNRPLNIFLSSGPGVALTIKLMSEENWFRRARWLLFLNDSVEHFFSNTNLPVDCNVLVAHQPLASDKVILSEVYRVTRNLPLTENYYGQWCIEEGFTAFSGTYYSRRSHLQGLVLRAAALNMPPTSEVKYKDNKIQYGGYVGLVWNVIEEQMKFRTEYVLAHNMGTGSEVNGTWTGLVGMVVNNKVDVALELFSRSTERVNAIDFSSAVYYDRSGPELELARSWNARLLAQTSPSSGHIWPRPGPVLARYDLSTWNYVR
uniref:Ionotropic glutamate receptor L-glutamate and glycine-binding domain-containing protein n=1 Tax=Timema bartmani TaxID=61472 RepID=A0A7R9FAQ3_9NEOP|nr:unnamed protein product [Timema bartmani]